MTSPDDTMIGDHFILSTRDLFLEANPEFLKRLIEFREEFLCSSCNHHYVHGYKSGNFKLCGGCHQKNGGKTNNARGSMEHWRAGNEVKLSQD